MKNKIKIKYPYALTSAEWKVFNDLEKHASKHNISFIKDKTDKDIFKSGKINKTLISPSKSRKEVIMKIINSDSIYDLDYLYLEFISKCLVNFIEVEYNTSCFGPWKNKIKECKIIRKEDPDYDTATMYLEIDRIYNRLKTIDKEYEAKEKQSTKEFSIAHKKEEAFLERFYADAINTLFKEEKHLNKLEWFFTNYEDIFEKIRKMLDDSIEHLHLRENVTATLNGDLTENYRKEKKKLCLDTITNCDILWT